MLFNKSVEISDCLECIYIKITFCKSNVWLYIIRECNNLNFNAFLFSLFCNKVPDACI